MGKLEVTVLDRLDQLRPRAESWDRLWKSSEVALPTARAELVRLWAGHFAPNALFRTICIEDGGEMRAALPLVGRWIRGVIPAADLTSNYWSANGELLIDPSVDLEQIAGYLVAALKRLPWPVLWIEMVPYQSPRWSGLLRALSAADCRVECRHRYSIGQIEIRGSFEDYFEQRSRQFLRTLRKDLRRAERTGTVALKVYAPPEPSALPELLLGAFEVERRGWKGVARGAVLDHTGIFEFYCQQAQQLAQWNQCLLAFLLHNGKPIAYEFGWTAKGVYHSFKVGYDEEYRRWSPGHLLRMLLVRHFHEEPGWRQIDFQGPMTDALAAWSTQSYRIGRVVVGLKPLRGGAILSGVRLASAYRRWRESRGCRNGLLFSLR